MLAKVALFLTALFTVAPSLSHTSTPAPAKPLTVAVDILQNIQANGYNPCTNGLYINWIYGQPGMVNMNGTGAPDASACTRHDRLTDLRYLQALAAYTAQYPDDHQFDASFAQFTTIVKNEFKNSVEPRGWTYFVFRRLATLTGDDWYSQTADHQAQSYAHQMGSHTDRVDWHIEEAGAMVDDGTRTKNAALTATGTKQLDKWYKRGYVASIGLIVSRGQVEPSEVAEEIEALVAANRTDLAAPLLKHLDILWDAKNGGYFQLATYGQKTGLVIHSAKKDAGRQAEVVRAARLIGDSMRADRELAVLTDPAKAYYQPGHGILFEDTVDWQPVTQHGIPHTWVTTEAMGCVATVLLGQ